MNVLKQLQLEDKRNEVDAQLKKLRAEQGDAQMSTVQRIAELIHDATCTSNHVDACSWGYEISNKKHDWSKPCHKHYLKSAESMYDDLNATADMLPAQILRTAYVMMKNLGMVKNG